MKKKMLLSTAVVATSLIAGSAMAHACAVCLSGDSGPMGDAYNWSILFLMATPYAVMGSVGTWLVYKYRRATAKETRMARGQPVARLALHYEETGR